MILLDTDHLSVFLETRNAAHTRLLARIDAVPEEVALPIITIEEQLRAWLAQIRRTNDVHRQIVPYLRLAHVFRFTQKWRVVDWNERAADHFEGLRSIRIRIGTQDLKIAAIALANDAVLLSANLRDFEQVPGLRVENWLDR